MLAHQIHLASRADREWLVFIHGAGGSSDTWKYQLTSFKDQFHLLLLDLRDHGRSKNLNPEFKHYHFGIIVNDIIKVLNHCGILKANFMTLSFGSVLLQALQQRFPERINKTVMAGAVLKGDWKLKLFVHVALLFNKVLSYRQMYETFSYILMPKANHQKSRRIYRLQALRLTKEEYLKWLGLYDEFFEMLKTFFYRPLDNPCAVIVGEQDHVFFESSHNYTKRHPEAKFIPIHGSGHICNIDRHEAFNRLALDFLLNEPVSQSKPRRNQGGQYPGDQANTVHPKQTVDV